MDVTLTFTVNGEKKTVTTDSRRPLLDVLREDLHLTGTKYGCGEGACRACTVLLDGKPVASCVTPVSRADKKKIVTIEGLAQGEALHPVQQGFLAEGRTQCGYCVPGMVMRAAALLEKNPRPTDQEIVAGMNGNICRCCGYPAIVNAVKHAAALASKGASDE